MFGKNLILSTGITLIFLLSFIALPSNAMDADNDGMEDGNEINLAEKYAPILYFEKHEQLFPVEVEYHISNSNLNRSTKDGEVIIDPNPTPEKLGKYKDVRKNYSLDNRKGGIYDDRIIEDYREKMDLLGYTVYAHIFMNGNRTIIQYWMFYAFNKGTLNNHEGDWEMVQVVLDSSGIPLHAMYSQHISGQKAKWKDVEKDGEHMKVYVARGSHANYFRYFQGLMGLARDRVGKNGRILKPGDYKLIFLGEKGDGNHNASQNWIGFAGRWGEFGEIGNELRGERGPYGPAYRENGDMWYGMEWGYSLPSIHKGMLIFEWFVYHFVFLYSILFLVSLGIVVFAIYRRHKKYGIKKPFSPLLDINGINAGSISAIIAMIALILAVLSLFYPWYGVFAEVRGENEMDMTKIISIDGIHGIEINMLKANEGMTQIGALPIPFSIMIGVSIVLFVLGTIGLEKKKVWRKYLWRGMKFIIPVVLIILSLFLIQMIALRLGEVRGTENAGELMKNIVSHPLKGESTFMVEDYGEVNAKWGLETGAYFLLMAGILIIIAGMMEYVAGEEKYFSRKNLKE